MIDYASISKTDEVKLKVIFYEWIDWFIEDIGLDPETVFYTDQTGRDFTVAEYIRDVKEVFGFHSACKEYFTVARAKGGKDAVIAVMVNTAPVVLRDYTPVFPDLTA